MVIAEANYDITSRPSISEPVRLATSGADTSILRVVPKFTAQAIRKAHEIGWKPSQIVITAHRTRPKRPQARPALKRRRAVTSLFQKVPTIRPEASDKSMIEFQAFMRQWAPGEAGDTFLSATGYSWAQTLAEVLRKCGEDLTRKYPEAGHQSGAGFRSLLFIDGVQALSISPNDRTRGATPAKMARFDGTNWEPFGDIVTIEVDKSKK